MLAKMVMKACMCETVGVGEFVAAIACSNVHEARPCSSTSEVQSGGGTLGGVATAVAEAVVALLRSLNEWQERHLGFDRISAWCLMGPSGRRINPTRKRFFVGVEVAAVVSLAHQGSKRCGRVSRTSNPSRECGKDASNV